MTLPTTRPTRLQTVLLAVAAPAVVFALYMALIWAPDERTLGTVQRIFCICVGSAWSGYLSFLIVFVCSIGYLLRRSVSLDALAASGAEIWILFTTRTMATGSFWA